MNCVLEDALLQEAVGESGEEGLVDRVRFRTGGDGVGMDEGKRPAWRRVASRGRGGIDDVADGEKEAGQVAVSIDGGDAAGVAHRLANKAGGFRGVFVARGEEGKLLALRSVAGSEAGTGRSQVFLCEVDDGERIARHVDKPRARYLACATTFPLECPWLPTPHLPACCR